jgi:UDPglucose 6-dehydrogenase
MVIKNICCIGAGYVGGPTMAVIADQCQHINVTVVDTNPERISAWNSPKLPIYEPGLDAIVLRRRFKNLWFSTEIDNAIACADCVFISVNTPTKLTGLGANRASDLRFVEASARRIAASAKGHTLVVEKSTLPVKSAETISSILGVLGKNKTFEVLSNPEFLAEGTAINDLLHPDRVLIGGKSQTACVALAEVYKHWVPVDRILVTNLWSAEMTKLASNAFLAQRVSSINAISAFCEESGADIDEVANAIGKDSRIGSKFLQAGPGFGGSCFKKDILNLAYLCEYYGLTEVAEYWGQVVKINEWQKHRISRLILKKLFNNIAGKKISILGFSFKKNTNDVRETPALEICKDLVVEGAELHIYDPQVSRLAIEKCLRDGGLIEMQKVNVAEDLESSLLDSDAAVIITDWEVFKNVDWVCIGGTMRRPAWVFDTRNCLSRESVVQGGLNYWGLGKPESVVSKTV